MPARARFELEVVNTGPNAATNVAISDPLPGQVDTTKPISAAFTVGTGSCTVTAGVLRCTLASLAAGARAVVTLSTTLRADTAN